MLFILDEKPVQKELDLEKAVEGCVVFIRLNVPNIFGGFYVLTKNKRGRQAAKLVTRLKGISLVQVLIVCKANVQLTSKNYCLDAKSCEYTCV